MTKRNGTHRHLPSEIPSGIALGTPLGLARRGYSGVIQHLAAAKAGSALSDSELESRLIELGFVEGARVQVLHEGIVGRDPIAVRVENVTIAVRRREAMAIIVA
jgi:ferrous iron transport protein A